MRQLHSLSTNNYSQYPGLSPGLFKARGFDTTFNPNAGQIWGSGAVAGDLGPASRNDSGVIGAGRERGWAVKADNNGY
jgi:hypothetical protein